MKLLTFTILTLLIGASVCWAQTGTKAKTSPMTDVAADGLKGKVKQVINETEYLPEHLENLKKRYGSTMESGRRLSYITSYDEKGDRTQREFYSDGKLSSKYIYGYLEEKRISKEEYYSNMGLSALPGTAPVKPRDDRFSFKFLYQYDERGNRIEEVWVGNTGDIWIKDTIAYDQAGRIVEAVRRFEGKDKISSVTRFEYDDRGRLKQEVYFDGNGKESEKHYAFEYDAAGNWIKCTVSKQTTYNPEGVFEPFLVTYRKITYF